MSESCRNGEDSLLLFLFAIIISSNFNIKLGHNIGTLITASHKAGALPSPPLSAIHSTSTLPVPVHCPQLVVTPAHYPQTVMTLVNYYMALHTDTAPWMLGAILTNYSPSQVAFTEQNSRPG